MDKRGIRYQQAERTTTAEGKVKRLRLENEELRKALFRATESARIANEEADARAASHQQSRDALREQLRQARAEVELARAEVELWKAANPPAEPGLFERFTARFRSPA